MRKSKAKRDPRRAKKVARRDATLMVLLISEDAEQTLLRRLGSCARLTRTGNAKRRNVRRPQRAKVLAAAAERMVPVTPSLAWERVGKPGGSFRQPQRAGAV